MMQKLCRQPWMQAAVSEMTTGIAMGLSARPQTACISRQTYSCPSMATYRQVRPACSFVSTVPCTPSAAYGVGPSVTSTPFFGFAGGNASASEKPQTSPPLAQDPVNCSSHQPESKPPGAALRYKLVLLSSRGCWAKPGNLACQSAECIGCLRLTRGTGHTANGRCRYKRGSCRRG